MKIIAQTTKESKQDKPPQCDHCGLAVYRAYYLKEGRDKVFCCLGCRSVYELLQNNGLGQFYEVKKSYEKFNESEPAKPLERVYDFVNDPDFESDHVLIEGELKHLRVYLHGIDCMACLWLIEKLPEHFQELLGAKLDLSQSVASLTVRKESSFERVLAFLARMGHKPTPLKRDQTGEMLQRDQEKSELLRIGVAGAGAMNIMLYAISIYAGAPTSFSYIFSKIILILGLPVLTYSAYPFYKSAWLHLKERRISLDLPVAFALFYGSLRGVVDVARGGVDIYFDTLTVLVFLLLSSRYVVKKWGRRGAAVNAMSSSLGMNPVLVWNETQERWVTKSPEYIELGQRVRVGPQEFVPLDGYLVDGQSAYLQTALMTGESLPRRFDSGDMVLAGAINAGESFEFIVEKKSSETTLARILKDVRELSYQNSYYSNLADQVARKLVPTVFILAAVTLIYFGLAGHWTEGERRALSLIIITCPCALGLATPLALSRGIWLAQKLGIIFKDENALEKTSELKRIVLDKTGTLTHGNFSVLKEEFFSEKVDDTKLILSSLERHSAHPIASAIREHYAHLEDDVVSWDEVKELPGQGVEGQREGCKYFVGQAKTRMSLPLGQVAVELFCDDSLLARLTLGDEIRQESASVVKKWIDSDYDVWILSGDRSDAVKAFGREQGITEEHCLGDLRPEDKASWIEKLNPAIMVGDGGNDALALKRSTMGVAVKGSMELALKSADVFLTQASLKVTDDFLSLSRETVKVLRRNLNFSLSYNVVFVALALTGHINPLVAAIVMPLSSLTVVGSTLWGTKELRQLGRPIWKS